MKDIVKKLKSPEFKAAFKSYARAVAASAVTMGIALTADSTRVCNPNRFSSSTTYQVG